MKQLIQYRCFVFCATGLLFVFPSCNIREEIWLNKNGSGKYTYEIVTDPKATELFTSNFPAEGKASDVLEIMSQKDIDTILPQKEYSNMLQPAFPNMFNKTTLNLKSDHKIQELKFRIQIPFKNIAELNEGISNFRFMKLSIFRNAFADTITKAAQFYELKDGALKRNKVEDFSRGLPVTQTDLELGKLMFMNSYQTIVFHLPNKVKSTSYVNRETEEETVEVKEKTVTVKMPFAGILTEKNKVTGKIEF
ncbi:hypothetical protein [Flavobacterium sp.]|uniref:hypothetical protein n=1 Tax=Flavobacterium sp. TaxID=239 RepID=UPI0026076E97|nr:hypothetical protein [Flavobacterium sp.]